LLDTSGLASDVSQFKEHLAQLKDDLLGTPGLTRDSADMDTPVLKTPPPRLRQTDTYRVKLNTGDIIESQEIAAVLRDPRDGRLVVYIDNVGYRSLVDSPEVKNKFVKMMKELSEVVTRPDDNPPGARKPEPALTEEKPERPELIPPPPVGAKGEMPGDLPSFKLDDHRPPPKGGKSQPIPELNIAGAIEAYLQHKLKFMDEFANRVIHVHSAPGGGVRIQVDNSFYDAVGDVADEKVRAFLSATIQEWQNRQF
jgi:hypothetical protein